MTLYGDYEKRNIKLYKKSKKSLLIKELNYIDSVINNLSENKSIYSNIEEAFCRIKDIKNTIKRLEQKNLLDEIELFEIKNFVINSNVIKVNYDKLNLDIDYINFKCSDEIIKILDPDDLKLPTFKIYDSYSNKLKEIREEKLNIEKQIFSTKDSELIKKLKDKRLDIIVEEEKEELIIKENISYKLYKFLDIFKENIKSIGKFDFLLSKAKLAIKYNAIKPEINNENNIFIKDAINPYIVDILKRSNKNYTPISIEIEKNVTLITGANMGGKSISMKNIVLNLLLFQCGFYVFAEKANLPVLDFVYIISDDMQDVDKGLSTFGAEIIKLRQILKLINIQDGFIALDEFARGTNPKEGKILIKSICKYLKSFNSIALISTHFDDIVEEYIDHYQVIGLKNVNFKSLKHKIDLNKSKSVDILQENMDYRLEKVSIEKEIPKDAINICTLLGIQNDFMDIVYQQI